MRLPFTPDAVIFDLDGTLVDTAEEFVVCVQALRAEHNRPPMEAAAIRRSVSNGALALTCLALDLEPDSAEAERQRQRLLEFYSGVLGSRAGAYPGIPELVGRLVAGGIHWGVCTNKPRAFTVPLLERIAIDPPPGSVVCPDDVTHRKPHPESLLLNCRELGCDPAATVYIGDHQRDIEAGRRAGMFTVAAVYGYIEQGDNPQAWGADCTVHCSTELESLLLGP